MLKTSLSLSCSKSATSRSSLWPRPTSKMLPWDLDPGLDHSLNRQQGIGTTVFYRHIEERDPGTGLQRRVLQHPAKPKGDAACVRHHTDLLDSARSQRRKETGYHVALFRQREDGGLGHESSDVAAGRRVCEYADDAWFVHRQRRDRTVKDSKPGGAVPESRHETMGERLLSQVPNHVQAPRRVGLSTQ